jgi:protocatechuate 3,4-dioxygenase alpha subunit
VTVFARGLLKQLLTRVYFPDETTANAADPILELVPAGDRDLLIAKPEGEVLRFDIRLQGEDETPFFAF